MTSAPTAETLSVELRSDAPEPRGTLAWRRGVRAVFRVVSFVEVVTWVGMLTGMLFKYVINGNGIGVTIFGWAHGVTWLVYLVALAVATLTFRWRLPVALVGALGSMFPFLTWPFERWMMRSGRLELTGRPRHARAQA